MQHKLVQGSKILLTLLFTIRTASAQFLNGSNINFYTNDTENPFGVKIGFNRAYDDLKGNFGGRFIVSSDAPLQGSSIQDPWKIYFKFNDSSKVLDSGNAKIEFISSKDGSVSDPRWWIIEPSDNKYDIPSDPEELLFRGSYPTGTQPQLLDYVLFEL